jgi:hypothetical protein
MKDVELLKKLTMQTTPAGIPSSRIIEIAEFSAELKKHYDVLVDARQRIIDAHGGKMFFNELEREILQSEILKKEFELPQLTPFTFDEISNMAFTGDDLAGLMQIGLLIKKREG